MLKRALFAAACLSLCAPAALASQGQGDMPGAPEAEWSEAYAGVASAVRTYIDGAQAGDAQMLSSVFHELGTMYSLRRGDDEAVIVSAMPFPDFVAGFTRPGDVAYKGEIQSMALVNDRMASAQVEFTSARTVYRDHLTLLRTDAGWKIVSKAYLPMGPRPE